MQGRNMPMPHILFMHRVQGDLLEGEGYFDKAFGVGGGHGVAPSTGSDCGSMGMRLVYLSIPPSNDSTPAK